MTKDQRSRNYTFTLNNWKPEDKEYLATVASRCIAYSEEVAPSTGTPHLQGFICFKTYKTLKQVIKILPGCHVERMRGRIDQNVTYCSKSGALVVHGDLPMSQKKKGDINRERWDIIKKQAMKGNIKDIDSDVFIRYYGTLKKIAADHAPKPDSLDELDNEWLYGPTGTGKSYSARSRYPDAYIKLCNHKWWDGYAGEETVIIDDFDKYQVAQCGDMKRWCDRYPFPAEFKGGMKLIRPKRILVTSNYHPSEIWNDEGSLGPILRRFKIKHMTDTNFFKKRQREDTPLLDEGVEEPPRKKHSPYAPNFNPQK